MNKLKYISSFKDRHGKVRRRFRRKGYHAVYLKGELGSPEFMRAYADAMENKLIVGESRVISRSISDLIIRYYNSSGFKATGPSTQNVYRRILEKFRSEYGDYSITTLERHNICQIMEKMADSPTTANRLLSLLSIMLDIALNLGWVETNHARTIRKFKYKEVGFIPWSNDELAKYEAYYPSGSRERLAYSLYLYTGQRGSDVYLMNRSHIRDGKISVLQQKTGSKLSIPIHPKLKAELDQHKDKHVFILTQNGKPYSRKSFQQWFVKTAKAAGLTDRSGHGLRKSTATRLAEAGCTPHEIQAITGHKSMSEVENYTKSANQGLLAKQAMDKMK